MDPLSIGMSAATALLPLAEKGLDLAGKGLDLAGKGLDLVGKMLDLKKPAGEGDPGKICKDVHQNNSIKITYNA
ncbi:hypothetical protein OOJ96_01975 [Pseudomonas sp. 15FMM2]|uniref:Uncharacterized protein n=1 Tax=Pseudomonas imrae TaxID=2992837 RepID=A0ACC7P9D8_9PSED